MTTEGRRYRILGVLGRGGFGTVYRAELLGEGRFVRQVALKVLHPHLEGQAEVARRMRDEARILGILRHRAIVQVDGLVRLDERWTLVMEYVEGVDLQMLRPDPIPVGPSLEIVAEIATALHIAYETPGPDDRPLRLVHRDVKPSNLVITPAGEVKILDFGVARANFQARESSTGAMVFGSPGYIAPERMDYVEGPRGDIYSLGVVFFEMLSGEPFGKAAADPVRHGALVGEAEVRLRARGVPDGVVDLIVRMTTYMAEERPSAREVESASRNLRRVIDGPWLRDWAESEVTERLRHRGLTGGHDFSSDVLVERTMTASVVPDTPGRALRGAVTFDEEPAPRAESTFPPPEPRDEAGEGFPVAGGGNLSVRTLLWTLLAVAAGIIAGAGSYLAFGS
jgi:serine/threonine protein kinase